LRRALSLLLLWTCLWLVPSPRGFAADETAISEDAVKAVYLHRFAGYVEWPEQALSAPTFTIGVMGSEAVKTQLERLLPSITLQGRPAAVRTVSARSDLNGIAILYVAPGRLAAARQLLAAAASRPVLIVTDDTEGLRAGGVINFLRVDRNVRFEVSQTAANRSGLKIDAALLGVAVRVETR
jgi:hypothetical protein